MKIHELRLSKSIMWGENKIHYLQCHASFIEINIFLNIFSKIQFSFNNSVIHNNFRPQQLTQFDCTRHFDNFFITHPHTNHRT